MEITITFTPEIIAVLSALVAGLSALYARWSFKESKKANDIGRLNSLLALRVHYLNLINNQYELAKSLPSKSVGLQKVQEVQADLDNKLREVGSQIEGYHERIIRDKI